MDHARRTRIWWGAIVAAFVFMLAVNPSGFVGGGQDDWHYLQAARCIRQHGLCLPQNHWDARWPVVAPIALFTWLLGESRLTVSIAPGFASLCAVILLALNGNRIFGRPVGWVAALLFLMTPAFSMQLTQPSVEATELCFIFAGFFAVLKWQERPRASLAFTAGLLFSLGIQVRETALVAAPFSFGYVVLAKPKPRLGDIVAASIGFALPFVIEFACFAAATGDPFYRLRLSMNHTQIWSSELLGPIDREHLPFFNKAYIANWRMEPGIHVYWAIDGLLNLFVNGLAGLSLPFTTIALLFGRKKLGPETSRQALQLLVIAVSYVACLIYPFAIDPKARMLLAALSMTDIALALITLRLLRAGYPLVASSIWFAAAIMGVTLQYAHERTYFLEAAARRWISERPGQMEMELTTREYLALVPAAQSLPGVAADRSFLLFSSSLPCEQWIQQSGLPTRSLSVVGTQKNTAIRRQSIGGALCLFKYNQPLSPSAIAEGVMRVRELGRQRVLQDR